MSMSKTKTLIASGLAALTLGTAVIASTSSAEARPYGYGNGYRHAGYGYYGGGYRRGYGGGGALAAGLIGGLAVGALAASNSGYGYGGGYGYGYPAYGYAPVTYGYPAYGGGCYVVRNRYVNPWGQVVVRREQVCE